MIHFVLLLNTKKMAVVDCAGLEIQYNLLLVNSCLTYDTSDTSLSLSLVGKSTENVMNNTLRVDNWKVNHVENRTWWNIMMVK